MGATAENAENTESAGMLPSRMRFPVFVLFVFFAVKRRICRFPSVLKQKESVSICVHPWLKYFVLFVFFAVE
jgi:hypothetical protein